MQNLHKNNLVAQANKLIEAKYTITKNEQLLLFAMISLINPDDDEFLTFSVSYKNLIEILGLDKKSGQRELKNIISRLMSRVIKMNTPYGWKMCQWVSSAELNKNTIYLKFHDDLKPYLLALKENGHFTQTRLGMVIHFRSVYTIRIYQILKEYNYKKINRFEFSLEEFREIMLGDKPKIYPLFKNFRNKVLDVAKKELNKIDPKTGLFISDLTFDLETRRTGRKISHLIFIVKKQRTKKIKTIKHPIKELIDIPTKLSPKPPSSNLFFELIKHGLSDQLAERYLQQKGEKQVRITLDVYQEHLEQGKVKKLGGGYLIKLLDVKAGQQSDYEQLQERIKQEKREEKNKKNEEMNMKLDTFFNNLTPSEQDSLIQQYLKSKYCRPYHRVEYEVNGLKSEVGKSYLRYYLHENKEKFGIIL